MINKQGSKILATVLVFILFFTSFQGLFLDVKVKSSVRDQLLASTDKVDAPGSSVSPVTLADSPSSSSGAIDFATGTSPTATTTTSPNLITASSFIGAAPDISTDLPPASTISIPITAQAPGESVSEALQKTGFFDQFSMDTDLFLKMFGTDKKTVEADMNRLAGNTDEPGMDTDTSIAASDDTDSNIDLAPNSYLASNPITQGTIDTPDYSAWDGIFVSTYPIELTDDSYNKDVIAEGRLPKDFPPGVSWAQNQTNFPYFYHRYDAEGKKMDPSKMPTVALAAYNFYGSNSDIISNQDFQAICADTTQYKITYFPENRMFTSFGSFNPKYKRTILGAFEKNTYLGKIWNNTGDVYKDYWDPYYDEETYKFFDFKFQDYSKNNAIVLSTTTDTGYGGIYNWKATPKDTNRQYAVINLLALGGPKSKLNVKINFKDSLNHDYNYSWTSLDESKSEPLRYLDYDVPDILHTVSENYILDSDNTLTQVVDRYGNVTSGEAEVDMPFYDGKYAPGRTFKLYTLYIPAEYIQYTLDSFEFSTSYAYDPIYIMAISGKQIGSIKPRLDDDYTKFEYYLLGPTAGPGVDTTIRQTDKTSSTATVEWNALKKYTSILKNNKFTDYVLRVHEFTVAGYTFDENTMTEIPQGTTGNLYKVATIKGADENADTQTYSYKIEGLERGKVYKVYLSTVFGGMESYPINGEGNFIFTKPMNKVVYDQGLPTGYEIITGSSTWPTSSTLYADTDYVTLPGAPTGWKVKSPSNAEYAFKGWVTSSGQFFSAGQQVPITSTAIEKGIATFTAVWANSASSLAETPSGSGTQSDPYQISTAGNLLWMMARSVEELSGSFDGINYHYKYYKLMTDIDMQNIDPTIVSPIGGFIAHAKDTDTHIDATSLFSAGNNGGVANNMVSYIVFDGNYRTISNYSMVENNYTITEDVRTAGLFGNLYASIVKDLTISNMNIHFEHFYKTASGSTAENNTYIFIGGVAGIFHDGTNNNSRITNTQVNGGNIWGRAYRVYAGGLVGQYMSSGFTLEKLGNEADVSGIGTTGNSGGADTISKATVGGLFGRVLYLNTDSYVLQNSYNTGKVYGTSKYTAFVGGLIGRTEMDSVVNSAYTEIVYENLYNSGVVQYEKYHYDYSDYGYAGTLFGRIATPYKNDDPTTKGTWFNNLFYRNEAGALIYGPLSSTHLNKTDIVNVAPEWLTGFTDVRLNYNASGSYSAYNASNNLVSNKGQDLSNLKNDSSVPQPYSATMSLADLKTLNTYYSVADETYKFDTTVWKLVEGQLPELQYSGPNIIEFYPGDRSFTLAKGDTRVITPYARLKPDYTPSSDWEWTSSNPSLLTVNSNGALNLLDDSSTTPVTITLSSKSATPAFTAQTAVVTPVKVRATGIHLSVKSGLSSDPTVSLATYETPLSNFDIYVQPISATIDTFTLKMEDTSIAYIDNVKKVIVAVKPGTTKLIATSTDGNYKAEIPFTVTPILTKSIAISVQKIFPNEIPNNIIKIKSYDYLYVKKLSTMVTSEKADAAPSIPRLEWTSSDDSVAYVMEDGTVIGAREGTTTIRATATDGSGVYGEITIEVTSDRVSDIIPLVSNTPRVLYGSTTQLYVQVVTSTEGVEPLNKKLIWSSSDPSIASVDQRGFVKVFQDVDAGKVTITAKSEENPAVTEAFQPYSYKKPTSIRLLDSADYARMGQDRTVALGVYQVLPEDVELNPNDIIIESSDSSIVQVVKDATTGEYLVKSGQKTGTAFVRAKIRGTMLSDAAKVNVLQNIKVLVTVKDEDNQPLNGVSIDAEGVTYITGTNPDLLPGQAEVIVMPDVPTLTVKFTKEGYKSVDTLEGLMLKGTYSLIMKRKAPGDDMPYYKMAMVIDGKDQTFDILNSNHPTDKRKKSKVYATVDWGDFEAPVMNFIKGPGKMTIGPNYLDVYRTPGQFYYNFFSNNIGIFDSKAVPLNPDGTENTSHALSKVLTWDVADYDHRYDDIDLNSATMDAVLTESFGMQLPDRVPMKFTITGDHFVGAYYYTSQTDKLNGDGSVSQEVIADSNMADEIEYWINTGKKTANIDKNMQAPKDKKVEKRYNASVTVMGYIVGDFAYRTEIQELKDAGALGYLGDRLISRAEYEAYLSNYPNRKVPVPMMYLNISKGGLMSSSADSTKGQVYAQNPENLVVEVCLGASYYERLKFQSSYGVVQFNGQTKMQNYYAIRAAYSTTGLWEIGATVSGSSWVITTYPKPRQKKVYETMDFDIFGRYLMLKVTIPMGHYESKPLYTIYPDKDRSYGLYSANESLQNYASTPAPSEATVSSRVDYSVYANYNEAETSTTNVINDNKNVTVINMTYGYSQLAPQLVKFGDGQMLIWEDDKSDRTQLNSTNLMYSIYTPATETTPGFWSVAKSVYDDGTADGRFNVLSANNTVYIVFENHKNTFADRQTISLKDYTSATEICLATYDAMKGGFAIKSLSAGEGNANSSTVDYKPMITANDFDANIAFTWLRNSNSDISGTSGTTSIIKSTITSTDSTPVYSSVYTTGTGVPIQDYTIGYSGSSNILQIAYKSGNVIYLKKGSQSPEVVVEGGTGTVGHLTMTNLNNRLALMWWNSNGNIYYVPDTYLLENIIPIFSKQSSATIDANGNSIATAVPYPATINYQVIKGDNGKAALVYLSGNGYDDPNDGTDIYKQKTDLFSVAYNSTTRSWDDYQANISNINEEIGTISGFIDNEGFYNIAETMVIPIYESITGDNGYQTERYKDSAAQLKILKVKPAAKLEVEDGTLYYSPDELEVAKEFLAASPSDPQTLNTYVNVRNTGERQIKGVRLTMYETVGDTVTVATYVYYPYVEINPGDEYQPLEIAYNVPQNLTERTLKVLVTPLNELYESVVDETYRVGIAVIGGIDLSLDISTRLDKNLYSVSGMALNKSDRAVSGVNVDVYLLDPATMGPTGNPIETFSFTTIDAKAGKPFQFTWDIGDTSKVYFGSNQSNSYVIVVSSTDGGTDIKPYNNDETFGIQNPYKSFLPFNVSVSDFAQTESKISFDLIASNNLPVENSGDVKVTILDSDNDELGVRTIEINNIKGEESRLTTVEFTGASVLQDAYMVVARFISSANGTDFIDDGGTASVSDDVYYFSNVQITPLAAFTYSSDNSVSSFILEPVGTAVATMDRSFSDSVLEYRLNPFTPGKFRVAVESGDLNATMAYQIDNGRMKYILSGEKSEEFELGQGEVLSLIVTAQNQEKKEFKFITPPRLDADLTGITFTSGILSPAFNKDVLEYNLNSARSSNIKFTPTASDTRAAKIEYQIGETDSPHIINSGTQTEYVNLNAGDIINIKVTAQDETTIKEYRIKFTGVVYDSPVSSSSPSVTPTPPPDSGNGKLPVINAMLVNFDDIKDKKSNGIDILVNNKKVELATETSGLYGDQQISFVQINDEGVINRISAEKDGSTITINAEGDKNITVISLNAQTVKEMENRKDILSVQSGNITFTIPAQEFSIDNVSKIIGESVRKEDIKVNVVISSPAVNVQNYIKTVSSKNNYSLIIPPVQFDIICQYGDKKVEVAKFNSYVERIIEIPSDVDPFSITTAVVLGQDGSMTPVPTKIVENGGKYYASFSSMSNSVYTLIGYQKEFRDIFGHWSERNIHELALKLIVNGYSGNTFAPENDMTRAEFATITVNALGLMRKGTGKTVFDDVAKKSWYFDAVSIAYENGIVSGTTSDTFSPNDKITREQAMTMISRAMKLTGLFKELDAGSEVAILSNFTDSHQLSDWATGGVAQCIRAKIVNGVSDLEIAPMENITRAEVAAIISRLLKKSGLIN